MPLIDTSGLMETASRASGLSALVEEAQGAIPESVTVVDPTQSLQIVLRADGVVDDFQILMRDPLGRPHQRIIHSDHRAGEQYRGDH